MNLGESFVMSNAFGCIICDFTMNILLMTSCSYLLTAYRSSDSCMTEVFWFSHFLNMRCLTTSYMSSGCLGGNDSSTIGEALTMAEHELLDMAMSDSYTGSTITYLFIG